MFKPLRIILALFTLLFAGCALDDPYNEMTPLDDAGEAPSVRNRFPEQRGGFAPSRADKVDDEMTPIERLRQY